MSWIKDRYSLRKENLILECKKQTCSTITVKQVCFVLSLGVTSLNRQ